MTDERRATVVDLGRTRYEPVFRAMREYTDARDASSEDQIWLTEHEPVFTQGQAGKAEHLLMPGDIEVVQSDRGGQVSYHGPAICSSTFAGWDFPFVILFPASSSP